MLASELFDVFIAAGFEDADLVGLSFVLCPGDFFDEINSLTSVFIAKSTANNDQDGQDDANNFADAAGFSFADEEKEIETQDSK